MPVGMARIAALLCGASLSGCALSPDSEIYKEGASHYVNSSDVAAYVTLQNELLVQYALAAGLDAPKTPDEAIDDPASLEAIKMLQDKAAQAAAAANAKVASAAEARAIWLAAEARKEISQAVKNDLQEVWKKEAVAAADALKFSAQATTALLSAYNAHESIKWLAIYDGGINAINAACDRYMNDLFAMHRYLKGGQDGLAVLGVGSAALLSAFDASAKAIVSIAAAFGIATGFIDIVYNSLLFQLDPAIVKSIVTDMKDAVRKKYAQPANLPLTKNATVYALREYMDKCVPATIEAEITRAIKEQRFEPGDKTSPKEKADSLIEEIISTAQEAGGSQGGGQGGKSTEAPAAVPDATTFGFTPERLETTKGE